MDKKSRIKNSMLKSTIGMDKKENINLKEERNVSQIRADSTSRVKISKAFSSPDDFDGHNDTLTLSDVRNSGHFIKNNSEFLPHVSIPIDNTIIFERSIRPRERIDSETIILPAAPKMGEKPEIDILSTFLPAFITVAIGLVMFFVMHNAMSLLYSLPMSLSGVAMSMINYKKQIKKFEAGCRQARENFRSDLGESERKLKEINTKQSKVLLAENPELSLLIRSAVERNPLLWNRRPNDDDFLNVRLGKGSTKSIANIQSDNGRNSVDKEFIEELDHVREKYAVIKNVPICTNLQKNHITGIVGTRTDTKSFIRSMVVQLAASYCYTELRIVYLDSDPKMNWVKRIPHAIGSTASTREEADKVLEDVLNNTIKEREKITLEKATYGRTETFLPYILFIVADPTLLSKNALINKYIINGERYSSGVVMTVETMEQLPFGCKAFIQLKGTSGELRATDNVSKVNGFIAECITQNDAEKFSLALQNVRIREDISGSNNADTASIPTRYSFFDMLGIKTADELNLKKRWAESDVCSELKAPLGIGERGIVELNISGSDSADGPHGLVAGTTGSGKSETIVSYLLALATNYSPVDLSLVIIDFKGGAMCNKFKGLPHLIGSITNLADKEIERSLKMLDAEVKNRQRLMEAASELVETHDIDSINKYTRLYKSCVVKTPMPHLVIVADEFAELKAQYPAFLDKLISIARIGRSLGVHLILATQKPAGQVNDQIWSNSKFRICLKVQTEQDSKEVIKNDLAAKIKEAGRAYLMVGFNERFELLQSGYSGVKDSRNNKITQFNAVVNLIELYCKREGIQSMPSLFMSGLTENIDFPAISSHGDVAGTIGIGVYDDPGKRKQDEYAVSLTSSNLMIIGSAQMGKTNLLQTIIRGLSERYTPEELSIYILDFASLMSRKFDGLNHVGGVITSNEDEKLKHFMRLIDNEFSIRTSKFAEAGVSSLAAYRNQGRNDLPHIVVIIDNLTAMKELYFQDDGELIRLCRDGLSVGITVIVANSNTKGIGYKYQTYFDTCIALYNNDSGEYGNLFDHCRETVEKIPGRCLVMYNGALLDCQVYSAFGDDTNAGINDLIARSNKRYGLLKATQIPQLPDKLTTENMVKLCNSIYKRPYSLGLGLDFETVEPVVRNASRMGCLALAGGESAVQSAYLRSVVYQMNIAYPGKTKIWIIDSIERLLKPLADLPNVVNYSLNSAIVPEIVSDLEQKVKARMAMFELGDADVLDDTELLVLIINNPSVADTMNMNKNALVSYGNLISKYRDMGICVMTANAPNASFVAAEFYKKTLENKQFLWFDNLSSVKIVTPPYSVTKKYAKKIGTGEAYLFNDTECSKLKTPIDV